MIGFESDFILNQLSNAKGTAHLMCTAMDESTETHYFHLVLANAVSTENIENFIFWLAPLAIGDRQR